MTSMIVAGLMSGTSCDGIDVAIVELTLIGSEIRLRLLADAQMPWCTDLQQRMRCVMAGDSIPALEFCRLDTEIGQAFADALIDTCGAAPGIALSDIDLVSSHGQTLWHWEEQGRARGTLQMGNPAWIAERTGIAVVSDLRMRDVAAGGNGAPLVSLFDTLLAAGLDTGSSAATGFLNLGGIANLTVIGEAALAYDLGPANALMDLAASHLTQGREHYDRQGELAARGRVDEALLKRLMAHPYFRLPVPRSTGKETFDAAYLDAVLSGGITASADGKSTASSAAGLVRDIDEDVIATLNAQAAMLVVDAVRSHGLERLIISGGGAANPVLRRRIVDGVPGTHVLDLDEIGLPGATKEACAFAVLGFLTYLGLPGTLAACTGARRATVLGNLTPGHTAPPLPGQAAGATPPCSPDRLIILSHEAIAGVQGVEAGDG